MKLSIEIAEAVQLDADWDVALDQVNEHKAGAFILYAGRSGSASPVHIVADTDYVLGTWTDRSEVSMSSEEEVWCLPGDWLLVTHLGVVILSPDEYERYVEAGDA